MQSIDRGRAAAPLPAGIRLVRWPVEEKLRSRLAEARTPRLLLVPVGAPAPTVTDELEDWVRDPFDVDDLEARSTVLLRRARGATSPEVDLTDGLVRVGARWISVTEPQLPLVRLLVERRGSVVTHAQLREEYARHTGSANGHAVKSVMWRLTKRLAEIGVVVHNVRGRGYLLDVAPFER